MTIKEILNQLSEFSPELFQGNEQMTAERLADSYLSYYDADAVVVADSFSRYMPAIHNAGTVIISEDALHLVSPMTINVIIVRATYLDAVGRKLRLLLD